MGDKFTIGRTRTIMKTSSDANKISNEATMVTASATELFLKQFVQDVVNEAKEPVINYKNVADVVHSKKKYNFLKIIIPQKITVKDYKLMLEKKASDSLSDFEANDTDTYISSGSEQYYGDDERSDNYFEDSDINEEHSS